MLFQIGESVKQGAVAEAAADATAKADQAELDAIAAAASDATSKADAAEAAAEAYTDAALEGIDLDEIAELTSEVEMLDDTKEVSPAAASFDLANVVPAGAAIISVQLRLDTAITGVSGATKVGVGITADPDKYGKTSGLTTGLLVNTTPAWVVLGGSEDVKLFAVDNAGAAAGTIGGEDEVIRVRVIYTQPVALP